MPRIFSESSKCDIKRFSTTKNRCAFGFIQQPAKSVNISSTIGRFYCKVSRVHKRVWFEKGCLSLLCKINKNRLQVKRGKENPTYLARDL